MSDWTRRSLDGLGCAYVMNAPVLSFGARILVECISWLFVRVICRQFDSRCWSLLRGGYWAAGICGLAAIVEGRLGLVVVVHGGRGHMDGKSFTFGFISRNGALSKCLIIEVAYSGVVVVCWAHEAVAGAVKLYCDVFGAVSRS